MKRPVINGSTVVSPSSAMSLQLLGGRTYKDIAFTNDEFKAIQKLYGFTEEDEHPNKKLYQAGADRNAFRHAESDGLRLLAWLAKYLEPGQDPLKTLIQFAADSGVDVEYSDIEYAEEV